MLKKDEAWISEQQFSNQIRTDCFYMLRRTANQNIYISSVKTKLTDKVNRIKS